MAPSTTRQLAALQLKPYYPPTSTPIPTRTPTPTTNPAIPSPTTPPLATPAEITSPTPTIEEADVNDHTYKRFRQCLDPESGAIIIDDSVNLTVLVWKFGEYYVGSSFFPDGSIAINSQRVSIFNSACYISATSPALFIYSEKQENVGITLYAPFTYVYPITTKNSWNIITNINGTISDEKSIVHDYLYYEYDSSKVTFAEPKEGYVVKKDEWKKAAEIIATQVGLNDKEKQALFIDIQNVLPKIKTLYMKISIVNEREIAEKLPLTISPTPNSISRIHLLLSPQQKTSKPLTPILSPIARNGFTVIEVGVAVGKVLGESF